MTSETSQLENESLRDLMGDVTSGYRAEWRGIRAANDAAALADQDGVNAAIRKVQRANDAKFEATTRLEEAFPDLGGVPAGE